MRNLKKVLSLVLVFAMACTMMAGAAYGDQKDIVNTDAVNMLSALNIIKGGTDGNFNPEKTVTRAEMAKMIYVLKNSGNDDGATYYKGALAGPNGKPVFSDTTGHWAQGYINWAYSLNIINGRGNGKFDPDASVTGLEAAKMLLTVLGYKPTTEGMTGTTWAIRTAALASDSNLFEDYTPAFNAGCPRDYAAQMIYNAIFAKTIVYRDGVASKVGYDNKDNKDLGELAMDLKTVNGTLLGNGEYLDDCNDDEFMIKATEDITEDKIEEGKEYTATYDLDLTYVGEEVKVLYKEGKNSNDGLDTKDTIYGVTPTGKTKVYNGIKDDFDDADDKKIKFTGTKTEVNCVTTSGKEEGVEVIFNFDDDKKFNLKPGAELIKVNADGTYDDATKSTIASAEDIAALITDGKVTKSNTDYAVKGFAGLNKKSMDTVKVVTNDSNKVTRIYVTEILFGTITGTTSSKVSFAGKTVDVEDITIYDGFKKDDVVAYTSLFDDNITSDDAKVTVKKADVVEAKVTANRDGGKEIKVNDSYVKKDVLGNNNLSDYDITNFADEDMGDTYTIVMSGKFWVAAQEGEANAETSVKKLAMVETFQASSLDPKVKVLLSDGTEKTYDLDDDSYYFDSTKPAGSQEIKFSSDKTEATKNLVEGNIFSYSISGNEIKLTQDVTVKSDKISLYKESGKTVTIGGSSKGTDKSAVAFVNHNGDWDAYLSDNLDDLTTSDTTETRAYKTVSKTNNDIIAFVFYTAKASVTSTSDDAYGFTLSKPEKTTIDGDDYTLVTVWNGSEEVQLKSEDYDLYNKLGNVKGLFIRYKVGSDKMVDNTDVIVLSDGTTTLADFDSTYYSAVAAVDDYSSSRKTLKVVEGVASNTYAIADDVKIIYVNTDDTEKVESGTVQEADNNSTKNIVYVYDKDEEEIVAIFVDVDNEMKKA